MSEKIQGEDDQRLEELKVMSPLVEPTSDEIDETRRGYLELARKDIASKAEVVDAKYSTDISTEDFEIIRQLRNRIRNKLKHGPGSRAWTEQEIGFLESLKDNENRIIILDDLHQKNALLKMGVLLKKDTEYRIIDKGANVFQLVKLKK